MPVSTTVGPFAFQIAGTCGAARAATLQTPHGPVVTPAFMPVGTLATVKALDPEDLRAIGAGMILANAYHLHLRPGDELIRELGGLHRFMGWDGPILTDSGGFQVFSLEGLRTVSEDGVEFRSHIDGSKRFFTPEGVIRIEHNLGADVIMQFDHVIPGQSDLSTARDASDRSIRWLLRCQHEFERLQREGGEGRSPQALFPIVQGGIHAELRREAARTICDMGDWPGIGIGGLSVGEGKADMYGMLDVLEPALPAQRPRYLMGVGFPEDLLEGVRRGVDMFDCVAPTRMGRNGTAFTAQGRINIKRAEYRADARPLEDDCECSTCRRFSRAYLRHLYVSDEMLGLRLLSMHNVHFLTVLMRRARLAILDGSYESWSREWLERLSPHADVTP
jgi:queuine tRNA-ribosyltransferase